MVSSGTSQEQHVRQLLDAALQTPEKVVELSAADLDLLLRVARRVRLLGRLAVDLQETGAFESVSHTRLVHPQQIVEISSLRSAE